MARFTSASSRELPKSRIQPVAADFGICGRDTHLSGALPWMAARSAARRFEPSGFMKAHAGRSRSGR